MDGRVVEGFPDRADPSALADATIYVPTRRAARALALELAQVAGGDALVLPRIIPLGVMEGVENDLLFDASTPDTELARMLGADLPAAVGDMQRRLILTALVHAWSKSVRGAIQSVGPDGRINANEDEPMLVSAAPAARVSSGGRSRRPHRRDDHRGGRVGSASTRSRRRISRAIGASRSSSSRSRRASGPIISSRSTRSTRRAADGARAPPRGADRCRAGERRRDRRRLDGRQRGDRASHRGHREVATRGAVVLPGLDTSLDDESWAAIAGERSDPASGHPQGAFRRLLPLIGITREDVRELARARRTPIAARMNFICEAMRPAETTERWSAWRRATSDAALSQALSGVTIIEAGDEREEALALAIALREAVETPGATAALDHARPQSRAARARGTAALGHRDRRFRRRPARQCAARRDGATGARLRASLVRVRAHPCAAAPSARAPRLSRRDRSAGA